MEQERRVFWGFEISPKFYLVGWSVLVAICLLNVILSRVLDGETDGVSAGALFMFLLFGAAYYRRYVASKTSN